MTAKWLTRCPAPRHCRAKRPLKSRAYTNFCYFPTSVASPRRARRQLRPKRGRRANTGTSYRSRPTIGGFRRYLFSVKPPVKPFRDRLTHPNTRPPPLNSVDNHARPLKGSQKGTVRPGRARSSRSNSNDLPRPPGMPRRRVYDRVYLDSITREQLTQLMNMPTEKASKVLGIGFVPVVACLDMCRPLTKHSCT